MNARARNVAILLLLIPGSFSENDDVMIGGVFDGETDYENERAFRSLIAVKNEFHAKNVYKPLVLGTSNDDVYTIKKTACKMISNDTGIVGVVGPYFGKISHMIHSICDTFELPSLYINWKSTSESRTSLNFHPQLELYVKGLSAIVRHFMWKSFVVLYEDMDGLVRLQDVLNLQTYNEDDKSYTSVTVKLLEPGSDYRPTLKEMRNSSNVNVILDCPAERVLDVLRQAKEMKVLEYYHNYFLTSLDAHTLDYSSLNTNANITTIRLFDPQNPELVRAGRHWELFESMRHNFDSEIDLKKIKHDTVLTHDAVNMFLRALQKLETTQPIRGQSLSCDSATVWPEGLRIVEFMKAMSFENPITGPIRFDEWGRRTDFVVYLVERKNGEFITTASWRPEMGDDIDYSRSETELQKQLEEDLQKTTVIVTSRIGPPYLRMREPKEGEVLEGNARYEGYSMDLIAAVAEMLNFTFRFELAKDKKYGKYNPETKQWDGLIRELLDRKAHLAICDLTITPERREAVDFSLPFMSLGISILYKKATKEPPSMFAFLDPFSFDVWIYTVTLYLGVSIMLYLVARMAPGDWENPNPADEDPEELENIWDIKNCLWLTLGSIMTQGCDILPKGISSRMTSSMWWFFSLIMTSSYTANLAAFLTADKMGPSIDSAEALAKQTKIKYGMMSGGSTEAFFQKTTFPLYQRMWLQMLNSKPSVFEKSNADGVKRVQTTKNSLYAFFMESSSIEFEVGRSCELKQVGTWLDSKGYGIAMPLNSRYRSSINKAVLSLSEGGKLRELKTKWWITNNPKEDCEEQSDEKDSGKLALEKVGGVFLVLGVGIAIAIFLAMAEFLWNVKNVSVNEHISMRRALLSEAKFAVNIWLIQKRAKPVEKSASLVRPEDEKTDSNASVSSIKSDGNGNGTSAGLKPSGVLKKP